VDPASGQETARLCPELRGKSLAECAASFCLQAMVVSVAVAAPSSLPGGGACLEVVAGVQLLTNFFSNPQPCCVDALMELSLEDYAEEQAPKGDVRDNVFEMVRARPWDDAAPDPEGESRGGSTID